MDLLESFLYRLYCICIYIIYMPQSSLLILYLSYFIIVALAFIFYGLFYFIFNFGIGIFYFYTLFFTKIEIFLDFSNLSDFNEFYLVTLDFNESYWVSLNFNESYLVLLDSWKNLMTTKFPEGFDSLAANRGGPGNWQGPILMYDSNGDYDNLTDLMWDVEGNKCPLPWHLLPFIFDPESAESLTIFAKLKSMDIRQDNYLVNYVEKREAAKIVENSFQTAFTTFRQSHALMARFPSHFEDALTAIQDLRLKTLIAQIYIECDLAYKNYPTMGDRPTFPTSTMGLNPEFTWQFLKAIYGQYQMDQEWYSRLDISETDTMIAQEKSVRSKILSDVQHCLWGRHNPKRLLNSDLNIHQHREQTIDLSHIFREIYRLEYYPVRARNIDSAILRAVYNPFFQPGV